MDPLGSYVFAVAHESFRPRRISLRCTLKSFLRIYGSVTDLALALVDLAQIYSGDSLQNIKQIFLKNFESTSFNTKIIICHSPFPMLSPLLQIEYLSNLFSCPFIFLFYFKCETSSPKCGIYNPSSLEIFNIHTVLTIYLVAATVVNIDAAANV